MELKSFFVQDVAGNVVPNPKAYVYFPGTTTLVGGLKTPANDNLGNPFQGSTNGQVQFSAPDGEYDLRVTGAGRDYTMRVRFIDAAGWVATMASKASIATLAAPAGATTIGAQHVLSGAQPEKLQAAYRRTIWADQFKLIIDIDDTACIERAIASGAAKIELESRVYEISDEIVISGICRLVGRGRQRTFINQNDLEKGALLFQMAYAQGCGLEHLTVKANAPSEQAPGSTGIGIKVVNCNDNATFQNFDVTNFDQSFEVVGCYQLYVHDFRFLYFRKFGLRMAPYSGPGTGGAGNRFVTGKISNLGFSAQDNAGSKGLLIEQGSGEFFNTIDVTTTDIGVHIKPTAISFVRYLFMFQVLGDSCLSRNWLVDGQVGTVTGNDCVQCWSSNSQGNGVEFVGTNIDAFSWNGGWNRDNRHHGFVIAGGTNVEIQASEITRNSAATPNTYHGVYIPDAVNVIARILDCRIGNVSTTVGEGLQKDNVHIAEGVTGLIEVSQCDLNDAGEGGAPINCISTQVTKQFRGNSPLASVGTNFTERYAINAHSIVKVPPGVTRYIGAGGALPGKSDSLLSTGRYSVIVGLRANAPLAPGDGERFTYTVMKNGNETGISGSIGPGQYSAVISQNENAFLVTDTDTVNVRLVPSAGAPETYHNLALIVEP